MNKVTPTHHQSAQNTHVLGNLKAATNAVKQLINDGYTVLDINLNRAKPVIQIQLCGQTAKLEGVYHRRGSDRLGYYRTLASVKYDGCQIEWTQR